MFLVLTKYVKPMEEVDKFLPAHSEFLDKYYAQKKIIFSGRRILAPAARFSSM